MVRVLFVCLGNICRSPTAEGVFRDLVRRENLQDAISTDSCGTSNWHIGDPPDDRARAEATRRGLSLDDLRARQISTDDFGTFDYVLGMDRENLSKLSALCPSEHQQKLHLFLSFAKDSDGDEVPDPYYGGEDGFRRVFDMIEDASRGLLGDIRRKHLDGN